jgi:sensor c-di-GMP phosphodiesterase-like protein
MRKRWPTIAKILLFAGSVAAFLAGGQIAADYLIGSQRGKQLEELGGVALRRSENAVEYGVKSLREIAAGGNVGCDDGALQAVRLHVYQRGAVKDIRLVRHDAAVICSAFSETLEFDKGWTTRDEMLPGANGVLLFPVEQFFGTALGAMIDVDAERSLVGILDVSGSLFDIMPEELRDHSEVLLELADGRMIARSAPSEEFTPADGSISLTVASNLYPLRAIIHVDPAALAAWNREPYVPIMALAGLLGAAFGVLLARSLVRPRTPLEEFDRALAHGEIKPFYQPIFDLKTGAIRGAEMLARWVRPDGTVISPARFIELAEENGRIPQMTWHLLRSALAELQALMKQDKHFKLSVNISPRHFVAESFVDELRGTVSQAGIATRQITLELTERESFEDPAHAAKIVAQVRDLGFKVAIDDVGIGHSGLSQIQQLRADSLKIDKFFVDTVARDDSGAIMIGMLVRLAEEMHMSVVAEGIEEPRQIEALIDCGVTNGQGYVVSPPVTAKKFLALVAGNRQNAVAEKAVRAA